MSEERVERRLAAILAADVAGYSRLIGADEQGTLNRLKAIRAEIFDPGVAAHNGRIVKTTGDGLLAEFASTVEALSCAGEIQSQIAERNAAIAADERIAFRIGIHQGDIVVEDGDIFGDGVNIAARLEALAEPGGICLSARVQEDAAGKLNLAFRDLGPQQLRNIARPVRAFAVGGASQAPRRVWHQRGRRAALAGGLVAVLAIAAAAAWWAWPRFVPPTTQTPAAGSHPAATEARAAPRLSIVVLPFANLSDDREQGYFADGVTEDLTTDLSRISNLMVIARNTAFTYKDKPVDPKQIGHELGVRYVLEGSVRRAGDEIRVNAQLVDAESGAHLWADRFDQKLGDLFALQNEITGRLANTLGWQLIHAEAARPTQQPDAVEYILRGRAAAARGLSQEANAEAIGLYEHALMLDPHSVEAKGRLANALVTRVLFKNPSDTAADVQRAQALIAEVLAVSSNDPVAHFAKGRLLLWSHRGGEAIAEFEATLVANPNDPYALVQLSMCKYLTGGSDQEAIALTEQAQRLSPRDADTGWRYTWIGFIHMMQSRTDEAIRWLEKGRSASPRFPPPHWFLAAAYGLKGQLDNARVELAEANRLAASDRYSTIARIRANGDLYTPALRDRMETVFFAGLRKAGMPQE